MSLRGAGTCASGRATSTPTSTRSSASTWTRRRSIRVAPRDPLVLGAASVFLLAVAFAAALAPALRALRIRRTIARRAAEGVGESRPDASRAAAPGVGRPRPPPTARDERRRDADAP